MSSISEINVKTDENEANDASGMDSGSDVDSVRQGLVLRRRSNGGGDKQEEEECVYVCPDDATLQLLRSSASGQVILVWRWSDAPGCLTVALSRGGDEDYLAFVPKEINYIPSFLDSREFGCCSILHFETHIGTFVLSTHS